jgi:hypothetical protein
MHPRHHPLTGIRDGDYDIVVAEYRGGVQVFLNDLRDARCLHTPGTAHCAMGWRCIDGQAICSACERGYHLHGGQCVKCPVLEHCVSMVCTTHDVACLACEVHYVTNSKGLCEISLFAQTDRLRMSNGTLNYNAGAADFDG